MKRFLLLALLTAGVLYGAALALLFIFQRSFVYLPPSDYLSPAQLGSSAQEVAFNLGEDGAASAWWIAPENEDAPVVMFFHGNGSAVYSNYDIYADLRAAGYGVMGVGYAGYPGREGPQGKPTQAAIVDGAAAQYGWLLEQGIAPARIIFYGTSLGTGVASQLSARLSAETRPALLVLEAPFNSVLDMAKRQMPIFPIGALMKDQFRSDLALKNMDVPLLWMHGTADEVIPLSQGQKLYDGYGGPKSQLIVDGGRHTNLWGLGARDVVIDAIAGLR